MSDLAQALQTLIDTLDRCSIPFMIGGSIASGIHGVYRTSLDVDLVADLHPALVAGLIQELGSEFYADADMMRGAIESGRSFNLIHFASSYKFDLFPLTSDAFQQAQFSRRERRSVMLAGREFTVPVATAEDTLLMKLVWYRSGGEVSERQWNDVRGIVAVKQARLNRDYVRHWAAYLKIGDLVDAAFAAA